MKHTHLRASTLLALLPMAFAAVSGISAPASAQTASVLASQPRTISYQGVLEQNGSLVQDGDYTLHLTLYGDAAGTSPVWQGTYTVHTTNGVFNVPLGSGQYPFPTPKAMDGALWLGVKIGEGAELPLTALSATAYAMNVADGSITAEKMATDYVGSISVNGQKITGTGTGLNFTSTSGMALNYDPTRNAIIFSGTGAGTTDGKGTNPLNNSVHTIMGTQNQVFVNHTYGVAKSDDDTLTLPQDIATSSSPSFDNLTLSGKGTSAATGSGDASTTLTTKGYVDNEVSNEATARQTAINTAVNGTTNTMAKFTGSNAVGNSAVTDDGMTFGINTNKFTVDEATGNTSVAGTSTLTGNTEIDGVLTLDGLTHLPLPISGILAIDGSNHVGYRTPAEIFTTAANNWILNQNAVSQPANFKISGNGTMGGTLNVTGAATLASATSIGGTLSMSGNQINNVANPTNAQDAATKTYVDNGIASETNRAEGAEGTLTTNLNNEVSRAEGSENTLTTNLNNEVSRAETAEGTKLPLAGGTMTGRIDMGTNGISDMADPTNAQDAATKNYVDNASGNNHYIQNGTSQQPAANFNIDGSGVIGGSLGLGTASPAGQLANTSDNDIANSVGENSQSFHWADAQAGWAAYLKNTATGGSDNGLAIYLADDNAASDAFRIESYFHQLFDVNGAGTVTIGQLGTGVVQASNGTLSAGNIDASEVNNLTSTIQGTSVGGSDVTGTVGNIIVNHAANADLLGGNAPSYYATATALSDETSRAESAENAKLALTGGTMYGSVAMGGNTITNMADPTNPQDAATKNYADNANGNNNYIQNGSSQQSANFNISGNGVIGGSLGIGTDAPAGQLANTSSNDVMASYGENGQSFHWSDAQAGWTAFINNTGSNGSNSFNGLGINIADNTSTSYALYVQSTDRELLSVAGDGTTTVGGSLSANGAGSFGGALNMNSQPINNVADPLNPQDAATKNYVDNAISSSPSYWSRSGTTLSPSNLGDNVNSSSEYEIGGSTVLSDAGNRNLFAGVLAGTQHTTGSDNAGIGYEALNHSTSSDANSAFGSQALANNTTAGWNVAIGLDALITQSYSNSNSPWTSANVAIGVEALKNNQPTSSSNGYQNTALGTFALESNTTGANNLAVGYNAGQSGTSITTGSNNTLLGAGAGVDNANAQNRTAIGSGATATADNTIQLGNSSVTLVNTSGAMSIGGALNLNSHPINNVTDPTNAQDAATKHYVDSHAASAGGTPVAWGVLDPNHSGGAAVIDGGYNVGSVTTGGGPFYSIAIPSHGSYSHYMVMVSWYGGVGSNLGSVSGNLAGWWDGSYVDIADYVVNGGGSEVTPASYISFIVYGY